MESMGILWEEGSVSL